jgi:uncharacterized repeat protein (TIGR02543 family)
MSSRAAIGKSIAVVVVLAIASSAGFVAAPFASAVLEPPQVVTDAVISHSTPATTSASAAPNPNPWSSGSVVTVSTDSSGAITYSIDNSSTAPGCSVPANGNAGANDAADVTATGSGGCTVDVSVAGDATYDVSSASSAVVFTAVAATTSASAAPSPTPWSSPSVVTVTTDSTGAVTYSIDSASTATGCSVATNGDVAANGPGACTVDVTVAADPNYLASGTSTTATFTAVATLGTTTKIVQTSATSASVSAATSRSYTAGPIAVSGNTGPVTFLPAEPNTSLTVSSSGRISTTGPLKAGQYVVSGSDSDARGDAGTWTYTLTVTPAVVAVTFDGNGGIGAMASESGSVPTALSSNRFVRKGYTFIDWDTSANGTGTSYVNEAIYPFTAATKLFAIWKRGKSPARTITFAADGGKGSMASEVEDTPTPIEANHFTRRGYSFLDWTTKASGKGDHLESGNTYAFKKSVILYAQWKRTAKAPVKVKSFVVIFLANQGVGKMAMETRQSPTPLTSNDFTRPGYTFVGWNTAANGLGIPYGNNATYGFKGSTNLYAQWKKIKVVIVIPPISGGVIIGSFAVGSSNLSATLESEIKSLTAKAKTKRSTKITLYGFGDTATSADGASAELGHARAGTVATYLGARLAAVGLKGWTISIGTASPSPSEIGSVVATLS